MLPYIVAIDGRAASGKTTLAESFKTVLDASVIHMDDFFLPPDLRSEERLAEPGGNVHYERFLSEVVEKLKKGGAFCYRKFDCKKMDFGDAVFVQKADVYVVEGAYSFHSLFGDYADFRIFCDVSSKTQAERIRARNGEDGLRQFLARWIPLEEAYISRFNISGQADIAVHVE